MDRVDLELAQLLLEYLRKWVRTEPQEKYNIIGRGDCRGTLELDQGVVFSRTEKQALLWIWSIFEQNRIVGAAHEDGWAILSQRGASIDDADLQSLLVVGGARPTAPQIDPVLGVPNRAEYDQRLKVLAEKADAASPLSLVVIDIDHFKSFNDAYGHQKGDEVLRSVARAVEQAVSGKGEAFRYGGEEIAVLLPNHSINEALGVAERVRSSIENLVIGGVDAAVTASLGVSTLPQTASNSSDLFAQADEAMYRSKDNGRNQVSSASVLERTTPTLRPAVKAPGALNPSVRVRLKQGHRRLYILGINNRSNVDVSIEQVELLHNEIALMNPCESPQDGSWVIPAKSMHDINLVPATDPATSLVQMYSNRGLFFDVPVEFVLDLTCSHKVFQHRQKIVVRVEASNGSLTQIVG